ncbi:MAG TPA: amidohydrolase family protein [Steroidobacteraceae bacterium]|nr:amidohydrolase family protein [Steroidobacteraceae bacterium]
MQPNLDNTARIWGIADRAGSLDVGKDADVVIWHGDPLETRSWPLAVFIRGIEQPDTSVCAGERAQRRPAAAFLATAG